MSQVLPFQLRKPMALRRSPALRMAAILTLIFFAAAVVWTTIVSMGGICLTSDSNAQLPRSSP